MWHLWRPLRKGRSHPCRSEILNEQFLSVFTQENDSPLPQSKHPEAPPFEVIGNGVFKLLQGLDPHMATGPDCLSSRLLKEIATPLTPALTIIYQASLDRAARQQTGELRMQCPISRRERRVAYILLLCYLRGMQNPRTYTPQPHNKDILAWFSENQILWQPAHPHH